MPKPPKPRLPRLLWKYCGPNAIPILEHMELKITRPSEFNDPFEWSPMIARAVSAADVRRLFQNPEWVAHRNIPMIDLANEKEVEKTAAEFTGISRELMSEQLEETSQKRGFLCLSSDPSNILMWSHYADNHRGFVIGIRHSEFRGLPIWPVKYSKRRVGFRGSTPFELHPKVRTFDIFTRKSLDWTYEREYRAVWNLEDLPGRTINGVSASVMPMIALSIEEVRLGYRASPELERHIRLALKAWKCKTRVVRAQLDPRLYKLRFQ
jgi:hypothetical protein